MKELIFIATTNKLTQKCLRIFNFFTIIFCLNRIIVSPDSNVAVISSLYQGVTNFTFLDALWFKTSTAQDISLYKHALASEIGLPICCLIPAMHAGCDFVTSSSHIKKMAAFQTLKNKIDELTNMINFDDFPHFL